MPRDEAAVIETHDFDSALREMTRDSVFVRPGAWLPPLAAQRLHWTARRAAGAATVSPVVDTLEDADPFAPLPDRERRDWSAWVRRVDECCAASSAFDPPHGAPSGHVLWVSKAAWDASGATDLATFIAASRAMRFGHLLADDVYALAPAGVGNGALASAAHRGNVRRMLDAGVSAPSIEQRSRPRQLHVLHGWGGGAEQWVRDYCAADAASENYVLTTECRSDGAAVRLCLYARLGDPAALRTWPLDPVIDGTREDHAGYRGALAEALAMTAADRVIVSSLVGHSLDALRTGLPTLAVAHDYYPFCPVFNITFGGTCQRCDASDLARCRKDNRLHDVFPGVPAPAWLGVRARFLADVERHGVRVVAPSESVRRNYARLAPDLAPRIVSIPHGTPAAPAPLIRPANAGRLRVLVPGRLSEAKGKALFDAIVSEVASFADLVLLGCGPAAASEYAGRAGVTAVASYPREALPHLLREHRPDVALLLSIVAETFSYTLQELFASAIAPVATRVGAFEDRVEDGVSGFLCDPRPDAIVARLRELASDRAAVLRVHETLRTRSVRPAHDMVRDYDGLREDGHRSSAAYFAGPAPTLAAREAENSVQLFWRAVDGGFNEAESVRVVTPPSDRARTLRLRFPPVFPKLGGFRLDPGSRPGAVVIASMRLLDPGGAAVWTWDGGAGVMDPATRSEIIPLGRPEDGPGQVLFLAGDDPHFGVGVPAAVLALLPSGGEWEVEVRHPPVALFIERLLAHVKDEEARIAAEYRRQVDAHQEQLRHERNRLMFVIESKESLLRQLMTALEGERAEVHALRGVTDSLRAEIVALRNSLSWKITAPLRRIAKPVMGA